MAQLLDLLDNESVRLSALQDLKLLDTPPSEAFDRITRLASQLFKAPVSTISLTDRDRQWFKSRVGIDHCEIPRERSPCSYAIGGKDIFVVRDLLEDERFKDAPLAQAGVRFYAGAPLFTRGGHGLGTICIIDTVPRDFSNEELAVLKDLAGMVMAQIELQNLIGQVDPTTGAPNQQRFFADVEDMARAGVRTCEALMIELMGDECIADLAHSLGTVVSDEVARKAFEMIREKAGEDARVYHVGLTRFAVVREARGQGVDAFVRRFSILMTERMHCHGVPIALDPSFGTYVFSPAQVTSRDAMRRLMITATEARGNGGRADYSIEHEERCARRFALINDFSTALDDDRQLMLKFQPRVHLNSGRWLGAEALLRWRHPELGMVTPGEFIPLIEKTALVRPLMDWVARSALTTKAVWQARGVDMKVAINASALNLDEEDFAERLLTIIRQCQVDPAGVEIEFTESAVAKDPDRVIRHMEKLRAHGVALAIDDFGTGYSSLAYVRQLPVTVLKIDQLFIRELNSSERARKLVHAMLGIASDLGCTVVAEGIETQQSLELLRGWGCAEGQGFHLAMPMDSREVLRHYLSKTGAVA